MPSIFRTTFKILYSFSLTGLLAKVWHNAVGCGFKLHWLRFCRGGKTPPTSALGMTQNHLIGRFLELWGMQSILSLLLLPGPLCPRVVALYRVLSMGQIEGWHLNWVQTNDFCWTESYEIEQFDHLTVCKKNDWCLIELLVINRNTWKY